MQYRLNEFTIHSSSSSSTATNTSRMPPLSARRVNSSVNNIDVDDQQQLLLLTRYAHKGRMHDMSVIMPLRLLDVHCACGAG